MKKSNVIVYALLVVTSAFLLWLWYFLRLNVVDEPLDLVLSIVWWVVIAIAIGVIIKMEQTRRQRIRTVYVGDGAGADATFNSEKGLMHFDANRPMPEVMASILDNLKYDFTRHDFPEKEDFAVQYFVRTKTFKTEKASEDESSTQEAPSYAGATAPLSAPQTADGQPRTWTGEVVVLDTQEEHPFESPEELAQILAALPRAAA